MKLKTGIGYDVHKLAEGYSLTLGGVKIESDRGSVGHSDADVAIHAIIDALFGAANLRDIGFNYPDSDMRYKGIDSKLLLTDCAEKIAQKGFKIQNIDCVISLQSPKISSYIPSMQQTIAGILHLDIEDVSIKATTTEHLGFVGRKEGIEAYAVALLLKE
ncbi:MAG: 2-C-methyl-D-erythritol 2,4-cyclodiphosphate synthase [Bacteroidales bacterium]|jgi:2-C-methyl-D-erythritol 2,4-cyclodiphosphate synthase|nr:2-C-methyl-D-erythritol 2,4-cyclodiphosphate synthase [Bacteroidales bacterium]